MFDERCEVLILGATVAAAGILAAAGQKAVIVESRPDAGYEFFGALRTVRGKHISPVTEKGIALHKRFSARDSLRACTPLFYATLQGGRVYLSARVLDISRQEEGFAVTVCDASGERRIFAQHLVDTRAEARYITAKRLNVLFMSGRVAGIDLPAEADMTEARRQLAEKLPELAAGEEIVAVADEFDLTLADFRTLEYDGILRIASAGYADPISAFDAGVLLGEELMGR